MLKTLLTFLFGPEKLIGPASPFKLTNGKDVGCMGDCFSDCAACGPGCDSEGDD